MFQWLKEWLGDQLCELLHPGKGFKELVRRLDVKIEALRSVDKSYNQFSIPKKNGSPRQISAPNNDLKKLQRRILRRLLNRLPIARQATGFRKGVSFVDNARSHQNQKIAIKNDLVDFFPSISSTSVYGYFIRIGWSRPVAKLRAGLLCHDDRLPQDAPTSPAVSNLVAFSLDLELGRISQSKGGVYTRYADDITISFNTQPEDLNRFIGYCFNTIGKLGFTPHVGKNFSVRRFYRRQMVTGLVVNQKAQLPRETRRWLRAVEHRIQVIKDGDVLGNRPTLSHNQLEGWKSLQEMISR